MDNAFKSALAKGIMVFAAAGDGGSRDDTDNPTTDYPAASPYVLSCGGTKLELDQNGNKVSESCWGHYNSNGASGGGVCESYPIPAYQSKISPNFIVKGRYVPDVSGNADPETGYEITSDGQIQITGGTSAVAPLYASLCAIISSRLGQPVSNWHSVLYSDTSVTVDVIGGDNQDYECTAGFDLVTGLGTIDGEKLLEALSVTNGLKILDPIPSNPQPTKPDLPGKKPPIRRFIDKLLGRKYNLYSKIK